MVRKLKKFTFSFKSGSKIYGEGWCCSRERLVVTLQLSSSASRGRQQEQPTFEFSLMTWRVSDDDPIQFTCLFFYQTLFQRKDNYVGGTAEMKRKSPFEAFVNDLPWPYFSLLASGEVAFKWYSVVRDFIGLFFFSYCRKDTTVVVLQQLFRAEQWIFLEECVCTSFPNLNYTIY